MLPGEYKGFSQSILYLVAFCTNIFFANSIDYFEPTGENFPLLHTWSLAIEEQFYFIFPICCFLLMRFEKNSMLCILTTLLIGSFLLADLNFSSHQVAFFHLPFRAWELLAGSVCSLLYYEKKISIVRDNTLFSNALSLLGLGLIVYAVVNFIETTPFPGRYAVLPVLGTMCVIMFAHPTQRFKQLGLSLSVS